MRKKLFAAILVSVFCVNCGMYEKSKDYVKDTEILEGVDPIKESSKNKSLAEARNDVRKSKKEYNDCLERNSNNEAACETQKARYDHDTEKYMAIQQNQ